MRTLAATLILLAATIVSAAADTAVDLRRIYRDFAAAQNAHDLVRVGEIFVDGPDFLWVSDGQSFWGREAVLARMGGFQKAETWRVEPELARSRLVELGADTALLHVPLTLVIGPAGNPDRLRFLVSILFVRVDGAWRIAALLTTSEKQAP